jgi:hypothetical protein
MRWDKLFEDLESQLEQELTSEELDLEAEEERLRLSRLSVRDRIAALSDRPARPASDPFGVTLNSGLRLTLRMVTCGRDWFSADVIDDSARHAQCIVPIASLAGVSLTRAQVEATLVAPASDAAPTPLSARLSLAFVLRDLCRRRRAVDLVLTAGELHGTLDRVGRDHVDVALHEPGQTRRESEVRELRVVPFAALQLIRL